MAKGRKVKYAKKAKKATSILGTALVAFPILSAAQSTMRTKDVNTAMDELGNAFMGFRPSTGEITIGSGGGYATAALVVHALLQKHLGKYINRNLPKGFKI